MKTAILAGIGRLGVPIAKRLIEKNWRLAVSYRQGHESERTVCQLIDQFGESAMIGVPADIVQMDGAQQFVQAVMDRWGRLDAVITIASSYPTEQNHWRRWQAGGGVTDADWAFYQSNFILCRNVILAAVDMIRYPAGGTVICFGDARSMLYFDGRILEPYMPRAGIVNVTPQDAKEYGLQRLAAVAPARHINPYTLAKIDIAYLTRVLALDLGKRNIRVNALAPGPILPPPDSDGTSGEGIANLTALGRWGGTDPIVRAVEYLIEDDYVTGEILKVDGGLILRQTFPQ